MKEKLKNNELTIGTWITIGHTSVVDIMASAGFEWLVVDLEHTSIDLGTAHQLISTIQSHGIKALVRVSKNEEVIIKRVLDMGADGIIVPMINSKKDAIEAINYAKYPPIGKRGVGLFRAQKYGISFDEYKKWVQDELIIIAQIEHYKAVDNIEEIIEVDDIDGVLIGPYDLSSSMGYPGQYERKDVKDAITKVSKICKEKNIPSGFHVIESSPESLQQKIKEGFTLLAYSVDFFFLGDRVREGMKKITEGLK